MIREEERTLAEVLYFLGLSELPAINNEEKIWAKACVKLVRRNGTKDYVVAEHDLYSWKELRVIKEFNSSSQPVDVLEIYPVAYLADKDIPKLASKEEIARWLTNNSAEEYDFLMAMSDKKLKKLFHQKLINISNKRQDADRKVVLEEKKTQEVIKAEEEAAAAVKKDTPIIEEVKPIQETPVVVEQPLVMKESFKDKIGMTTKGKPGRPKSK